MRGASGLAERTAEPSLPYIGHASPHALLLVDGSVLMIAEAYGAPHELAAAAERNAASRMLNGVWRNLCDETLLIGVHFVRSRLISRPVRRRFESRFAEHISNRYQDEVLGGELFRNVWFLSAIVRPRNPGGGTIGAQRMALLRARWRREDAEANPDILTDLDGLWSTLARSLEGYNVRRLGLREEGGILFSEIAEALRLILYASPLPVPLVSGRIGNALYTDRVVFDRSALRILDPAGERHGIVFGLREYMLETRPGQFDAIHALPFPLVLSQSFLCLAKDSARRRLTRKARQMWAANDEAKTQLAGIGEAGGALDRLMGGAEMRGIHHLSLAVYGDSEAERDRAAARARAVLAGTGAVVAQETLGLEAAWFAQLPGNLGWRTRPGAVSTRNFADMAGFAAFPSGEAGGYWGEAAVRFKTTAATAYDYVPHVEDVGMTVIFGRTGSGKSVLLTFLMAMFDPYGATIVFFDKDRGGEIFARAMGGRYLVIRNGEASGLSPVHGFENTAYGRDCLARWLKGLISLDGHGPVRPSDEHRLTRAVAAIMRLPSEARSLLGVRQLLGWRDPMGIGARLERWCRGGALGWAFDGGRDEADFGARLVGFDLTAILETPEVCNPAAQYLRDRMRPLIDGRRMVVSFDECRAYLLSPTFESEIKDFLLTLRKQNGIVILATQQPEDLLHGTFGPALVGQCQTLIFFPTPTADPAVYREHLHLTEGELRAIREDMLPGSRRILIKRRAGSVVVDFDLSAIPECVAVLSGRANTVRFADHLRALDGEGWVETFMARFREARD